MVDHQMQQPRRLLLRGPSPARAEQGGGFRRELRVHEEIAEGGMRRVRGGRREHHLRVTGQFNDARHGRTISDRDATQLHVVFGRHADFGVDLQPGMTLPEFCARLGEDGFVALGCEPDGLVRRGPDLARRPIAQIHKGPPAIARGVLAPAGDRQIAPATVAAPGATKDDMIPAVGQEMYLRCRGSGIRVDPHHALARAQEQAGGFGGHILGQHAGRGPGRAFLQQPVRCPEQRTGQETPGHGVVQQHIGQRQQTHPLMMRHEGPDGGARDVRRQPGRRIIDRLVETEGPFASLDGQSLQVFTRFPRQDHERQGAGIRGNHQVLSQASFQTEARHAEGAVLVVQVNVRAVIARFGNAPRHAAQVSIVELFLHRRLAGVVEQGVLIAGHDQHRHQILEHGTTPRHQDRSASRSQEQPAQGEPVVVRNLPQSDGHVAAHPRLRSQQIVVAKVIPAFGEVESGGKQIPGGIEQEGEIHGGHLVALLRQTFECEESLTGVAAGLAHALSEAAELGWAVLQGCRRIRRQPLQGRVDAWAKGLLPLPHLPQSGCPVEFGQQLVEPGCHRRGRPILSLGRQGRGSGILHAPSPNHRGRQGLPRHKRPQVLELLLATPLQRSGPALDFLRSGGQRSGDGIGLVRRRFQQRKRRAQAGRCLVQFRVQAGQHGVPGRQISEHSGRIAQPGEQLWREHVRIGLFPESGPERQQMSRQVAAVHARNVAREEGLERAGVVPIVEVPTMPLQSLHRGEGVLGAPHECAQRKVPHVPGRQIGKQPQAHVRG